MTEQDQATPTAETKAAEASDKTTIRPKVDNYVRTRTANGTVSHHSGDPVATALAGMTIDEVEKLAVRVTGDESLATKYAHLNVGQQRMNLGNRIRGAIAKKDKANEAELKKLKEGDPQPEQESGVDAFTRVSKPFVEAARQRMGKMEAEAKAKAEAKAAKAKAEAKAAKEAEEAKAAEKPAKAKAEKAKAEKSAKAAS